MVEMTVALAVRRMKKGVRDTLELMGIPVTDDELAAMVSPVQVRNVLIRQEYHERLDAGEPSECLFYDLAHKYGTKPSNIKAIMYKNQ
jgi:hypothetical protein